jgi:hypothetical protein
MKRTTRAKAKWRRRQSKAECDAQLREVQPDFLAEEVERIERAQYDDYVRSLDAEERDELERNESIWHLDIMDDYDYRDDGDYYDFHRDYDRGYQQYDTSDYDLKPCSEYTVYDAISGILDFGRYLSREDCIELEYMAIRLNKMLEVLRAKKSDGRRDRTAS